MLLTLFLTCYADAAPVATAGPYPTGRAGTVRLSAGLLERDRGRDVGQVGERLGVVAQQRPGGRVELLGEQPQVVGGRRRCGKGGPRLGGSS